MVVPPEGAMAVRFAIIVPLLPCLSHNEGEAGRLNSGWNPEWMRCWKWRWQDQRRRFSMSCQRPRLANVVAAAAKAVATMAKIGAAATEVLTLVVTKVAPAASELLFVAARLW